MQDARRKMQVECGKVALYSSYAKSTFTFLLSHYYYAVLVLLLLLPLSSLSKVTWELGALGQ